MGISIFTGAGTSNFPHEGSLLSATDIMNTTWEIATSLLIMPGGRDKPYHAALKGEGCRRIRRFVENGGTYLGICAGAYFGAEHIEFEKGFPLEVLENRELMFFQGAAVGPAYGKGLFDYHSQKGARAAWLKTPQGPFHAYYNGGCTFEGDLSKVRILARYADLPYKPPAIIECKVGNGKAILSGVHLERAADSFDRNDPYLTAIIPLLTASESKRREFWQLLTDKKRIRCVAGSRAKRGAG